MFAAVPMTAVCSGGSADLGADPIVIGVEAGLGHDAMPIVMSGPFAALMIQQVTHVVDLAAVPHRRAQHLMRLLQIGDEEAAGSPELERRLLQKKFPVHVCVSSRYADPMVYVDQAELDRDGGACCSNHAASR